MASVLLCQGTALHLPLKDASVHVCVCSPPYYSLRDYGTGTWQGGDAACTHRKGVAVISTQGKHRGGGGLYANTNHAEEPYHHACGRCGATRVDQQLGLEDSPELYIAAMVQVFREVKRVLHPMGTCWINMGTTYQDGQDLGMPWRVAFALKDDGWRLRSEIIYAKLNPMPESVQTRPTRAHEQVFMFSKSPHYHYDAMAVREPGQDWGLRDRTLAKHSTKGFRSAGQPPHHGLTNGNCAVAGRNMRSVLSLPSEPTPYPHFACMPTALVRRCLLAGAPSRVCSACNSPYRRVVERQTHASAYRSTNTPIRYLAASTAGQGTNGTGESTLGMVQHVTMTGLEPTCACNAGTSRAVILDPFVGSGTVPLVARELGHHAIGIDLSYHYLSTIARERLGLADLARWQGHGTPPPAEDYTALPLFGGIR